jgi:hypothetical protein
MLVERGRESQMWGILSHLFRFLWLERFLFCFTERNTGVPVSTGFEDFYNICKLNEIPFYFLLTWKFYSLFAIYSELIYWICFIFKDIYSKLFYAVMIWLLYKVVIICILGFLITCGWFPEAKGACGTWSSSLTIKGILAGPWPVRAVQTIKKLLNSAERSQQVANKTLCYFTFKQVGRPLGRFGVNPAGHFTC